MRTPFIGIFASSACVSSNFLASCAMRSGVAFGGGLNSRGGGIGTVDGFGPL